MKLSLFFTSDLHLGIQSWGRINPDTGMNTMIEKFLDELKRTARQVIDYPGQNKMWVLTGDIFHTPNPTNAVRRAFTQVIQQVIDADVDVLIIPGNHDRPVSLGARHSLAEIEALHIPRLTIISQPSTVEYNGLRIICLPWQRETGKIIEAARTLIDKAPAGETILIGHFGVQGAMTGAEKAFELYGDDLVPIEEVMNDKLMFTFLGHIHKHQILFNKLVYVGSMDRVDFSERFEEKGSYLFEFDTDSKNFSIRRILGNPQSYIQLNKSGGKWQEDFKVINFKDAVVKVKVECTEEERRKFDYQWLNEVLKEAKFVLPIQFETEAKAKREANMRMSTLMTTEQALKLWVDGQHDLSDDAKAKVLKAGRQLVAEPL